MSVRGADMARTASFCFGFSFGSKQERQDVSERGRYGPELPPFASDSALDLNRRGSMSSRGADMARTASFCLGISFGSKQERQDVSERGRYGPELPPFASDSALDLNRRGRMSERQR